MPRPVRCDPTLLTFTEYIQIIRAVGAGFLVMGAIGYVVKLIHIPIRHLIAV